MSIGVSTSFAQDGGPQFRPLEMWACTFNDRKDQDDMDEAYAYFAEDPSDSPYAAFQLNPAFVGSMRDQFDFLFIGVWGSGSAMGADMEGYLGQNDEAAQAWTDAADCGSLMFASTRIQDPQPSDDGTFVLAISDCNVAKGHSNGQAAGAIGRFNAYRVANGMEVGTILWYPVAGGGDAEFDFKLVSAFTGPQHWGDYFSWYVDNEAYNVQGQIMDGIVSCDESRIYTGHTIMNTMM